MSNISTFKQSLKATSLFGGVQVFTILIKIISSKVAAVLLGPAGMGVYGLFSQAQNLIKKGTSFGLSSSAVRNISDARGSGDEVRVQTVTSVFRRLVWITGLLGLLVCLLGAPILSKWTFGNHDYIWGFVLLSLSLLIDQLAAGQTAVLQGLRKYSFMARATVIGNTVGLILTVPLYYIWKVNAIVPVMVLSSMTALVFSWVYYKKLNLKSIRIDRSTLLNEGKSMAVMGLSISISGIVETFVAYYLRVHIGNLGGLDEVGLFTAGFAMVNTYVGLVLTSMGTDYYPRLSEVNRDSERFNSTMNDQMEIVLLLIAPIISVFIIFVEIVIVVLYSNEFLSAESFIFWAVYACMFKAISWCISYGFLAKGDYKAFIINELSCQLYSLPLQIYGYTVGGLQGLGIAYFVGVLIYTLQVFFVTRNRYNVRIVGSSVKIFLIQLPVVTCCLIVSLLLNGWPRYTIGIVFVALSVFISYKEIQRKVDVTTFLKNKLKKK